VYTPVLREGGRPALGIITTAWFELNVCAGCCEELRLPAYIYDWCLFMLALGAAKQ